MVRIKNKIFRQVTIGILIAIGAALYLIESLIFFPVPLPGTRWGFSNLVVLITAVNIGLYETLMVSIGKSVVGGLISGRFGNIGFLIGLVGSVGAGIGMSMVHRVFKKNMGYMGISSIGAFLNNLIQISLISLVLKNELVFYYLPYMTFLGIISAFINAFISANIEGRFKEI